MSGHNDGAAYNAAVMAVLDETIRVAKADAQARGSYGAAKAAVVFEEVRAAVAALFAERDALREVLSEMTELASGSAGVVSQAQKVAILAKARAALTTGESA